MFLLFVSGQGRRSTRARGRISEAKTQRRPRARERESEGGVFFVDLLFLYLSFKQGRARRMDVEVKKLYKGGDWVKGGGGLRRATA